MFWKITEEEEGIINSTKEVAEDTPLAVIRFIYLLIAA